MTKMKLAACVAMLAGAVACNKGDFLDKTATTDLTEQSVFADSARTMEFLTGIYSDVGFSFNPFRFGGAGLEASCDEAEGPGTNSSSQYIQWAVGSINANSVSQDPWNTGYANIRRVNVFFKNLPKTPLTPALKVTSKAEARFLRAWYYFNMVKHYGGVPLIGDTIYSGETPFKVVRNTFDDCIKYIVAECDAATTDLPPTQFAFNYGRITSGASRALKARVLLYAASPLFNGGQVATTEPLRSITGYPSADPQRWRLAADAAKAVMDLNMYKLHDDPTAAPGFGFYKVFTVRKNDEHIFQAMRPKNRELEGMWLPPSRSAGDGANPTKELADAFPMKNGLAITDPASGYDPNNPYANRDPRFNYTIIHNESLVWINSGPKQAAYTYVGVPQDGIYVGTATGFYINKMLQDDIVPNNFGETERCYPLIRYAEILLNYAEATNEIDGPTAEVYTAIESIRKRAGLTPFTLPAGLTKDEMRKAIQQERRIELAFEEHRFWDVRRWKIAEQTDNKAMHGTQITKNGSVYTYETIVVRPHTFRPAMYLWPLGQSELSKSPELLQNPGW
ncbi:RagB/SusD family nutrient uptake outer membrane protein [Paraflavitalea sp. CAU 1676]|uniref:RagB/SusD family nutrient uptake outer membrane protein n=1 Tax=Paraflavitalea sp. CAU 1676 TaxID=3032598 RepID=UPI0023DAA36E|nr:RagB/SusD family nutrient uptake outer membrane protein [Paraflavitalea sp. CAU 1676]MDF2192315.1 RagB/SusD family nutrient uptake outer membrane protein [Paraflavitalea sp. CAU 1676]